MKHILYLITRDDGQRYVGITIDYRVRLRMNEHRASDRFKGYNFTYQILKEDEDRAVIERAETEAVAYYDTFNNGLNGSPGGKGWGHNSPKFNTLGYKYSDESKAKMSLKAKERYRREGHAARSAMIKKAYANNPELRKTLSEKRKGVVQPHMRKLTDEQLESIKQGYESFDHPLIGVKSANGKLHTKLRLYAKHCAEIYPACNNAIYGHLKEMFHDKNKE